MPSVCTSSSVVAKPFTPASNPNRTDSSRFKGNGLCRATARAICCRWCSAANAGRSIIAFTFRGTQNPHANNSRRANCPRTGPAMTATPDFFTSTPPTPGPPTPINWSAGFRTIGSKNIAERCEFAPRRRRSPTPIRVRPDATEGGDGLECLFMPAPFRFCLHCGIAYGFRQGTDFAKLSTLGSEGRSTATSILASRPSVPCVRNPRFRPQPQAAEFHRQPARRFAAGWPFQRFRGNRPIAVRPISGGTFRRRERHRP